MKGGKMIKPENINLDPNNLFATHESPKSLWKYIDNFHGNEKLLVTLGAMLMHNMLAHILKHGVKKSDSAGGIK